MLDLGIDVLFKGTNMLRLLTGLWVAMKISLVSILISLPLGVLAGALMTIKNRVIKAIFRIYLEFIRIMPQFILVQRALWAGIYRAKLHPLLCLCCGEPLRWVIW